VPQFGGESWIHGIRDLRGHEASQGQDGRDGAVWAGDQAGPGQDTVPIQVFQEQVQIQTPIIEIFKSVQESIQVAKQIEETKQVEKPIQVAKRQR